MKAALLLLLALSLSFAGELWKVDVGAGVSYQPLVSGSRVIVGTSAGKIYSIDPPSVRWVYNAQGPIVSEPVGYGGNIIVPTNSSVMSINQYGVLQWESPLPGISGIAASDKIYVSDANGIQALNAGNGSLAWTYPLGGLTARGSVNEQLPRFYATPPAVPAGYVVFGYSGSIYVLRSDGEPLWNKEIGHMWDAPPLVQGNTVYAGTAEGILYSLDLATGEEKARVNVFAQISTSPVAQGSMVFFGTSDNKVYAVVGDGIRWSADVDGRVARRMGIADSGGQSVLYLSTTKSLYMIDPSDGDILLKHTFLDWPTSPAYFNGQFAVGTEDGKVYGIDSSKACSILYPGQDAVLGDTPLTVYGLSYSKTGSTSAQIRVNGGEWFQLGSTDEWEFRLDPSEYPYGIMEIECMAGGESAPYSMLTLVHVANTQPQKMTVTYPLSVRAGTEFQISVVDSSGMAVDGVIVEYGNEKFEGDGNVTLSLDEGVHSLKVRRAGYSTEEISIDSKGEPVLAYALGVLFLAGAALYVYFLFVRKEKKKELIIKEKH